MASASLKAPVLGKQAKADLPEALFGEELHESLLHEAARADLAARRSGTASTLGRSEVAMTTAKAWRQKGTGRARAGALSAPQRRGGGVAFGPKPRRHTVKVNRKARRRALRSALSVHASRGSVAVIEDGAFAEPSTSDAAAALEKWAPGGTVLVAIDADEVATLKSFRNLPHVTVLPASAVGVADLIGHAALAISNRALEILSSRASNDVVRGATTGAQAGASDEVAIEAAEPAAPSASQPAGTGGEAEDSGGGVPGGGAP